jgi:urease accessory protein
MIRAKEILPAETWERAKEADRVSLNHDGRHRRRVAMRGEGGTEFLLDLVDAMRLRAGDGLRLDDARIVRVVAAPEPILEVTGDAHLRARVAWHIGNRHVPAQILPDRIRIGRDHVLEEMLVRLGANVAHALAPFDPEPGAYVAEPHHHHGEGRAHDHAHVHGEQHDH